MSGFLWIRLGCFFRRSNIKLIETTRVTIGLDNLGLLIKKYALRRELRFVALLCGVDLVVTNTALGSIPNLADASIP
jgi:hypothetical protein